MSHSLQNTPLRTIRFRGDRAITVDRPHLGRGRQLPPSPLFHTSVRLRMQDPGLKYNPRAIYEGTETYESRAKEHSYMPIGLTVSAGSYAEAAGTVTSISRGDTMTGFPERRGAAPQVRGAKPRLDYTLVPLPVSCIMNCMGIKESGDNTTHFLILLLCWC